MDLHDLARLERRTSLRLPAAVRLARFDADGRRLLILTADHQVRCFDVPALAATAP